ncbi:protein DpdJ [Dyella japonica]|uniref:DEAD/DEAH box helicase n=1 Tax=Dyella japonica TaxID=231455 RepID=A0ABV2JZ33_9GAMM
MTLSPDLTLVEKALDELERREVRVLVWGLVDSVLSEAEVLDVLDQTLDTYPEVAAHPDCSFLGARGLLERLLGLSLLMPIEARDGRSVHYRSRMAEGVRLLVRLRQLMPKHGKADQWISAPNLVADYRLLWRPRRYPKRNTTAAEAREQLARRTQALTFSAVDHWLHQHGARLQLARFQVDAASRILENLDSGRPGGTLVAAGTGSGKTLAFYLPALSWLAAQKRGAPGHRGVRILAVYPRNELLKDQLREVFSQARTFDDYLGRAGAQPISVGVLYGETPRTLAKAWEAWRPLHGACPFFRCPACRQEMRLRSGDQASLLCRSCGTVVDRSQLRLTREDMQAEPPDVLFTSVEMLNQRMSDSEMRHLFGLGPDADSVPALMLLDEVHVYTGTYGAQVAYLLRRWSHLTRRRTSFVGLSATLAEGKRFFANLTGLEEAVVEEISPQSGDMEDEGAEYLLALRGDPVSQTALLSTSIQTLMLGSRLLDPREKFSPKERPFAGWRSFAFTDQVDATNRLFYDLRDAEGRNESGNAAILRHPNGGLAHLREPKPENHKRFEAGQDWRLATHIGHTLGQRHKVERTTSYDGGVDHDAEIVVATAALEVGYDDPAVGVVLQHKAPRDMAQFLQRKGRAGRTRHMRPWTLMVLSDYGRDRLAYQAYEQYFDPELPPRELPLGNRYVRRMQAVYAMIDYLGVRMQAGYPAGSVWRDLSGPRSVKDFQRWPATEKKQVDTLLGQFEFPLTAEQWKQARDRARKLAPRGDTNRWAGANRLQSRLRDRYLVGVLSAVLREDEAGEQLASFVQKGLDVRREDIDLLLWDHPRPLLLAAIPTALRRLASNWRAGDMPAAERAAGHPLPEFVPAALFSDLTLPETQLHLPNSGSTYALPALQALNEFAPGKVSRRFDHTLWLGPGEAELVQLIDAAGSSDIEVPLPVDDLYVLDSQPSFHIADANGVRVCPAFRTVAFHLRSVPKQGGGKAIQVQDSSNARLLWRSQIFGRREGARFTAPSGRVGIARLFQDVIIHTHASQAQATIRRFAVASRVNIRVRQSNERSDYRATWRFEKDGHPCGIGFEIEADALCFRLQLPASPGTELRKEPVATQRAARTARYRWEAQHGSALAGVEENPFARDWLAQIFQIAAVSYAVEQDVTLLGAISALGSGQEPHRLSSVLSAIFQSTDVVEDDGTHTVGDTPRLKENLQASLRQIEVVRALAELATMTLTAPFDSTWDDWLSSVHLHTLGAAVLEAIQQACPQISTEDLAVDGDPGPLENGTSRLHTELWISEINPGGNGLIEQLVEVLATDPTLFFRRIESALGASEFEIIDTQLRGFLMAIGSRASDAELVEITRAIRESNSSRHTQEGLDKLRRALVQRNQAVFHGFIAALSSRILRPHTPPDLDALLADFMQRWDDLERQLGVEVDARVTCALLSRDDRIDQVFLAAGFDLPDGDRTTWRFSVLLGLVWARGHALRNHALPLPLRFQDTPAVTERLLLQSWLSELDAPITTDATDWLTTLHDRLVRLGRATVRVRADSEALATVMGPLVTQPVQLEYLNVYPKLVSMTRQDDAIHLQLELEATT